MAAKLVWVVTFDSWDEDDYRYYTLVQGVYSSRSLAEVVLPAVAVDWVDPRGGVHTNHELYKIESFVLDF